MLSSETIFAETPAPHLQHQQAREYRAAADSPLAQLDALLVGVRILNVQRTYVDLNEM